MNILVGFIVLAATAYVALALKQKQTKKVRVKIKSHYRRDR